MISKKIFLIGLPGSGKTTFGKKLAEDLDASFIDLDEAIIQSEGKTIGEIFSTEGEYQFRLIEKRVLTECIQSSNSFIMATGGGTPCFFDNLEMMNKYGLTIHLNTPMETIKSRLEGDQSRPLMQANTLDSLYKERKPWYEKAGLVVSSYEELKHAIS